MTFGHFGSSERTSTSLDYHFRGVPPKVDPSGAHARDPAFLMTDKRLIIIGFKTRRAHHSFYVVYFLRCQVLINISAARTPQRSRQFSELHIFLIAVHPETLQLICT